MDRQFVLQLIKSRRKELGFTQKDMAQKLEVAQVQYSKYENGKNEISLERFLRIVEVLDIEIHFSMKGDEYTDLKKQIQNEALEKVVDYIEKLKIGK